MNRPVTFEIAVLLNEKGFNEECKYFYYLNDKELSYHIGYIGDVWKNSEIKNGLPYIKQKYLSPCISAPTIPEVIMWLYNNYDIWVEINRLPNIDKFAFITKPINFKKPKEYKTYKEYYEAVRHFISKVYFESPGEAYLEGIKHALKILIK